jgi:P-type Cu2+ transporter
MPLPLLESPSVTPAPHGVVLAMDDPQEQEAFTRWTALPEGTVLGVSQMRVAGMYCVACAGLIENAICSVPGVLDVQVNASAQRAQVRWDPAKTKPSEWVKAVQSKGYDAAPDLAASTRELRLREQRKLLWRLFVAGFAMMQVMMVAVPVYMARPGDIKPDLLQLLNWSTWVMSIPVMLFSSLPFFRGAWQSLRVRRIGMDVPVSLGIWVTFIASTGATFDPTGIWGHEVYFDSLTMFVFFLLGGRYFEMRARHQAAASLEEAVDRLPERVERLLLTGESEWISPRQIRVGDKLRVPKGEAFAADGNLISGKTQVDEALLTGESVPLTREPGQPVIAGSLNVMDVVVMEVVRAGKDTRFEGIKTLMQQAQLSRPGVVRLGDRIAGPFLWAVLLLAFVGAGVWSFIDPNRALWVAVSVLIVTCPCALSLAVPSVLLSAAAGLSRQGVLLQRMDALERLAQVDTVFFDKTGTLTTNEHALQAQHMLPEATLSADRALELAAGLAAHSSHPLSRALVAHAQTQAALTERKPWFEIQEFAGQGLQGCDDQGQLYRLGTQKWVQAAEMTDDNALRSGAEVWFGRLGQPEVVFEWSEQLRPDAREALAELHRNGLQLKLLSGDLPHRVQYWARLLGLTDARGSVSPEGKLQAVIEMQRQGHCVAMVGDGINDAPVLAQADISFAFAQGSQVAQVHADAVILSNRLGDVVKSFALAQATQRLIRQNLSWALFYNALFIPLAIIGWLPPWLAGLGMAVSSLWVVLNAQRIWRNPVLKA